MTTGALHARWSADQGEHEHVVFAVEGMHCAGCARAIDTAVRALPGVQEVSVNVATARVAVDWLGCSDTGLPQILEAVTRAGFRPSPLAGDRAAADFRREQRTALKRVGLASLGMMQAMMYLAALYGSSDIDASMAQLMRLAGMIITTPVLFYSGAPFFSGAWRALRNRRLGMDVPVALALVLAFIPSVINTFRGQGEVYFDSVGMFVFFLSLGRYVEMSVRHRGLSASEALARSLPAQVTRLLPDGQREKVAVAQIRRGDRFLVPRGGVVAVDAQLPLDLPAARALLDESLISGESATIGRGAGERIASGSLNAGDALTLVATAPAASSTLASMVALLERAQAQRPGIARVADVAASWFVSVILVLALVTGLAWWHHDASQVLAVVLAVLVVSCPCALSLATPVALAAATSRLARTGVLVTRADAIERLAKVDSMVFDKTGTLTSGASGIAEVTLLSGHSREDVLAIAAALERCSTHPLAAAFTPFARETWQATEVSETAGAGMTGLVAGRRWRLGSRDFAAVNPHHAVLPLRAGGRTTIYLGDERQLVAAIAIGVPLRPEARLAADALREQGIELTIASGDQDDATEAAARALGISHSHSRLSPDDKLRLVRRLRESGRHVCMVGDGINDGPVLAAADVSCAMGRGSAIAQSAADVLLVNEKLTLLPQVLSTARHAMRVVRQNLGWSLAYNFSAVPLAALGLVPPWLAALGMSLSSLGVVLNARRLSRGRP